MCIRDSSNRINECKALILPGVGSFDPAIKNLSNTEKNKIFFTHLNHTNPLLIKGSVEQREVIEKGFNIAEENMVLNL